MSLFLRFASLVVSLAVILSGIILWWGITVFNSEGPLQEKLLVHIEPGTGLGGIARKLEREGALSYPSVFMTGVRIAGAQSFLKAGEYMIKPGMSPKEIMELLREGKVYLRQVTIPEGLTSYEIVSLLAEDQRLAGEIETIPPEGSMLPETYSFSAGETRVDIVARMQDAMSDELTRLWESRAENLPLSNPQEAITLASIVEKETGQAGERAGIAGVFINRLEKGMPLQSDPTVIYALTGGKHEDEGHGPLGRRLLRRDMEIDSPYNTYMRKGLPPGPIANPGKDALAAVLNPERHDYYYFVADGTGGHVFSRTLAEHNRNAARWRKIRRSH